MKAVGWILLALGLLAGPGHFFYASHHSGTTLLRQPVGPQGSAWLLPGGLRLSMRGSVPPHRPLELQLLPAMSPIAVVLHAEYRPHASAVQTNRYRLSLFDPQGRLLAEGEAAIAAQPDGSGQSTRSAEAQILHAAAAAAGRHALVLEPVGRQEIQLARLELEVRRNASKQPAPAWTISGIGIAFLGLYLALFRRAPASSERRRKEAARPHMTGVGTDVRTRERRRRRHPREQMKAPGRRDAS